MSKNKTIIKRIALVAVSALGFGLMSVVPAKADPAAVGELDSWSVAAKSGADDTSIVIGSISVASALAVDTDEGATVTIYTQASSIAITDLTITANLVGATDTATLNMAGGGATQSGAGTRVSPELTAASNVITWTPSGSDATETLTTLTAGSSYTVWNEIADAGRGTGEGYLTISIVQSSPASTTATLGTTTTTIAGRTGNQVTITPTGTLAANTTASGTTYPVLRIAAAITSQPAESSAYPRLASAGSGIGFAYADAANSSGRAANSTSTSDLGTSSDVASIYYSSNPDANAAELTDQSVLGTITFTPIHVGTYTVVVWNESSTSGNPSLNGAESYQTFTVNVSAGVSTITLTPWNSTSVEDASYGSLVKVEIKDAAGNAAALSTGESISIDPTGSGLIAYTAAGTTGSPVATSGATAGGAYSLSASDFSGGVSYINVTNGTAETISLVASLSSSNSVTASTSLTFKTRVAAAWTINPESDTTGWAGSGNAYTVPQVASVSFETSSGSGATSTSAKAVTVTDVSGKVSGKTGGIFDLAVGPLGKVTVSATFTTTSTQNFKVAETLASDGAYDNTDENTFTVAAIDPSATANANIDDTVTINNSSLRVAPAGTASYLVTVYDQFGRVLPNATVTMTWAGRNTSTAATQKTGLTDANGVVALSYTDTATSTVTATSDTVTMTAVFGSNSSSSTATVTWLATTVGTLTLTSTGDTDVIAGTTKTDISAGVAGATATYATASALVKDANGVIIVGTPVTFTVSGLVGAEVHTTKATVYTDSTGTAVSYISSYAAGMATVTATAGTVTATDDLYFSQQTATEARTIEASVSGGVVTATVKDRYGNTIEGVTVNATRTGTGFFGSGASTATGTTDKNGVVEFIVSGDATVTVAFSSTTYGQSAAIEGSTGTTAATAIDAYVAGTTSVDQEGLGGSLAPAGVNSASVTVSAPNAGAVAAEAASDAALEAIDAANAATDAANLAAEAADAATVAAEEARDAADAATAAVEALASEVATLMAALKAQITTLAKTVAKIAKKVKA